MLSLALVSLFAATPVLQGHGTLVDREGRVLSEYTLTLETKEIAANVKEQTIHVKGEGFEKTIVQRSERDGNRLRIATDHGTGGGLDLGDGVITTYTPGPCEPGGGDPIGAFAPAMPSTFCCLPLP